MSANVAVTVAGAVTLVSTQAFVVPTRVQPVKLATENPALGTAVQVAVPPSGTGLGVQVTVPLVGGVMMMTWPLVIIRNPAPFDDDVVRPVIVCVPGVKLNDCFEK